MHSTGQGEKHTPARFNSSWDNGSRGGAKQKDHDGQTTMKELTINISKEFSRILGGREKNISDHSGEEFREKFLEENTKNYERIIVELDGVLGYPIDFLDETFGRIARCLGKKKFNEIFRFISNHTHITDRINYLVDHSGKE